MDGAERAGSGDPWPSFIQKNSSLKKCKNPPPPSPNLWAQERGREGKSTPFFPFPQIYIHIYIFIRHHRGGRAPSTLRSRAVRCRGQTLVGGACQDQSLILSLVATDLSPPPSPHPPPGWGGRDRRGLSQSPGRETSPGSPGCGEPPQVRRAQGTWCPSIPGLGRQELRPSKWKGKRSRGLIWQHRGGEGGAARRAPWKAGELRH